MGRENKEEKDEVVCRNCYKKVCVTAEGRCPVCGTKLISEFARHSGVKIQLGEAEAKHSS
jgi:rRNA maturation endonuclease Nob1